MPLNHAEIVQWWRQWFLLEAGRVYESDRDTELRERYQEEVMGSDQRRMVAIFLLANGIGRASHAVAEATGRDARYVFAEVVQRYDPQVQSLLLDTYNDTRTPLGPEMKLLATPFGRAMTLLRELGAEPSRLCVMSDNAGGESAKVIVDDVISTYLPH